MTQPRYSFMLLVCQQWEDTMSNAFDAIIIGAGQAGPSLAGRLTDAGMKLLMVERKLFGGRPAVDAGCMPTKTLVAQALTRRVSPRRGAGPRCSRHASRRSAIDMKRVKRRAATVSL